LLQHCVDNAIDAAFVLSCVGSLRHAEIRYAGRPSSRALDGKLEIVALSGTVSRHGCHLHIAVADVDGKVSGGHLLAGSRVHTTVEIVLGIVAGVEFRREHDPATGYSELAIVPRESG
jgi:predicted DNA-binding protein with PD1-like motif